MSDCNSNCESCKANCASREKANPLLAPMNEKSNIKHVIGVVSGKGGVGKSMVTSLLAAALRKTGKSVAILDADITGPSIPKAFGLTKKADALDENMILPVESNDGIKIMSLNLINADDTDPVIWRGPILASVVKQFWSEVAWGDVDYMLVDMPPGTGDVPLTVFQSLPIEGIVVVTSPQKLVGMIVEKAVKMANMMNVPILGLVENFSYLECPDCGKRINVFGESTVEDLAKENDIDVFAKIPIDPEVADSADSGKIADIKGDWLKEIVEKISEI
ncbi:MAG: Mrp/NBP35 family ATP-binding protein [Lachnospiraceae bacterium]|nr:Mrp/NBP35 family ATP-binding protein [Lachnospiraceae bacterium]